MIGNDIHPTTIVGIKRLAKALHKSEGIQHANALDLASTRAGFTNYRNALAALGSERTAPPKLLHTLFLTAYWRCHRPAHRSHLMIGTMEPGRDRHIGSTP